MVCSFGDQNDVAVFQAVGLTPFQAIDLDGCMTEISGPFSGMKVAEARKFRYSILKITAKFIKLSRKNKKYLSLKEAKTLLKLFYPKNGMFVKPTSKIESENLQWI